MIRVLIVDDEPPARRKVRRFLERDGEIGDVREAGSHRDAVQAIEACPPDLVFLDVQLQDGTGFSILDAIAEPHDFEVIFLTAHERHAVQAFDAEALDYLLKPVDPERFEKALERAKARIGVRRRTVPAGQAEPFTKRLVVQKAGREIFLAVETLVCADADGNYVQLHTAGAVYTIRTTLDQLARQLDPQQFARVNRSQIVNLDCIKEMQPWFHGERRIVLHDGRELTWTRRFRAAFQARPSRG
jgi:two-component system LytT family response regulator